MEILLFLLNFISLSFEFIPKNLFFVWTTSWIKFQRRHLAVLQSHLLHHPDWSYTIYTTHFEPHLISSNFSEIIKFGYDLTIEYLNMNSFRKWFSKCPFAIAWIIRRKRWKRHRFYNSHLTDLIRFCLIYDKGGIYADFDAFLLKPFDMELYMTTTMCHNGKHEGCVIIGMDEIGPVNDNSIDLTWTINQGKNYIAPGIIIGQKFSPVIAKALEFGFGHKYYSPLEFNHAGPKAITKAYKFFRGLVKLLPIIELYPVNYISASKLFKSNQLMNNGLIGESFIYNLIQTSTSLHFFGSRTDHLKIEDDSIVDFLIQGLESRMIQSKTQVWHYPLFYQIRNNAEFIKIDGLNFIHNNLILNITANGKEEILSNQSNIRERSLIIMALKPLDLSNALSQTFYRGISGSIIVSGKSDTTSFSPFKIPIYHISSLVTIVIKTLGRMNLVVRLIDSIKFIYPQISIVVGDDSASSFNEMKRFERRDFRYIPLPFDIGLSEGRNLLIKKVDTPYFFIIDDDFTFSKGENGYFSDLGLLIHALSEWGFDIVSGSSPIDIGKNGFAYQGIIKIFKNTLLLSHKKMKNNELCSLVDIVPNIFMGKTHLFKSGFLQWDKNLKLAEHEKFFVDAKRKRIKVGYCPSSAFMHEQSVREHESSQYLLFRKRVYGFLKEMLREMKLFRLITFGFLTINIRKMEKRIEKIFITSLQPSSAWISWTHENFCNMYQINIFRNGIDSMNSRLFKSFNIWPQSSFRIQKNYWLNELDPETSYIIKIVPGNYTSLLEDYEGKITFKTPSFEKNNHLHILDSGIFRNRWRKLMNHLHCQHLNLDFPSSDSILSYNDFEDGPLLSGFFQFVNIPVKFHKKDISIQLSFSTKLLRGSINEKTFVKLRVTVLSSDGLDYITFEDKVYNFSRKILSLDAVVLNRKFKRNIKLRVEVLNYSKSSIFFFYEFYCKMDIISSK